GVKVPTVRRIVADDDNSPCRVTMDCIEGRTLKRLWREIGWWSVIRIAWQLRRYL
ncbi:hypothetical protein FPV67DRAFT_1435891, partial [Lyophyllum atratum]